MSLDKTRLLGLDALAEFGRGAWASAQAFLNEYGPELLLSLLLIGVYAALFWALTRLGYWLLRRFGPADSQATLKRTLSRVLRLTFLLLSFISVAGLFSALAPYIAPAFRIYLLLMLLYGGWAVLHHFLRQQAESWNLDASLSLLLSNVARGVWLLAGIYLVFRQLGIDLLPILGGLGVVGLAVGFAAQDILANLISGVTLLLDRPFRIGDWIRVRDYEGQVMGLTLRTTRIRTRDNEFVSIPNKEIAGATVINLTSGGQLRLNVPLPLAYAERVPEAREVLLRVMAEHPKVEDDPAPVVLVRQVNETSLEVILRFYVTAENVKAYPVVTMQLREAAKEALQDAGFSPPYPRQWVKLEENATGNDQN